MSSSNCSIEGDENSQVSLTYKQMGDMERTYDLAEAAFLIRKLRWAILFAQAETETLPPYINTDSMKITPAHDAAKEDVHNLACAVHWHREARRILRKSGWNEGMIDADYDTLLACLPPHPLEQRFAIASGGSRDVTSEYAHESLSQETNDAEPG